MNDLTVPQAAVLLGLKPRSVRMFIERGMIKGEKRGRDWFISQDEVDRYQRERRKPGPQPGAKHSDETKKKLSEARKGDKNPFKGKRHTDETKAKMSAKQSQQARGEDSHAWKGGRTVDKHGYILVYAPDHPNAERCYVPEHRLVMEKVLGRYLTKDEEAHHKNGVVDENTPDNLEVLTKAEHSQLHRLHPEIKSRRS